MVANIPYLFFEIDIVVKNILQLFFNILKKYFSVKKNEHYIEGFIQSEINVSILFSNVQLNKLKFLLLE